jgi:dynein heavy chain
MIKNLKTNIESYFKKYMPDMLKFMRKNCYEPVGTVDNNLVQSAMRILDTYFNQFIESETNKVTLEMMEDFEESVEKLVVFALTWSIGATTNLEGRILFDKKFRTYLKPEIKMPSEGLIYDYMWDLKEKEWKIWTMTRPEFTVDTKLQYSEIVVPTFDSIRMQYLTKILIMSKKHVLCPGPTGTGKTVNINILLQTMLPEEY